MSSSAILERLDSATRSKLRSTQILTSLPQIISELAQNSIDANANTIEVGLYQDEWSCWVRDNGTGISKGGLDLLRQGLEKGRYLSSKIYDPTSLDHANTFGFRGEALASAADLSCIEISSRTSRSKESWSIILKGGEQLYYGPSTRWRRESSGTSVLLRDVFFNLPVRRLSHPSPSRTIELIKRELEQLALMHPDISFSLKDESKELSTVPERSRVLVIPKTASALATFKALYGRVLVEHVNEINEESGQMKLEGFISLVGSQSKSYQFIFVNRHIVDHGELHRILDKRFTASTFSKHALDESGDVPLTHLGMRQSPRKGDRHPVYVLNLTLPPKEIDNCLDPSKAVINFQKQTDVINFFTDVIQRFLARNGFSSKRPSTDNRFTFSSKRNMKRRRTSSGTHHNGVPWSPKGGKVAKKSKPSDVFISEDQQNDPSEEFTWLDPNTGKIYIIDTRTGHSFQPSKPPTKGLLSTSAHHDVSSQKDMPEWIRKALMANKAYAATEPSIPVYDANLFETLPRKESWIREFASSTSTHTTLENIQNIPNPSFSKDILGTAKVITQIDRKFIACIIQNTSVTQTSGESENVSGKTLLLIDQHAADERIRVEKYLKSLCLGHLRDGGLGIERRILDPPVPVLLTEYELEKMNTDEANVAFRSWGFDIIREGTRGGSLYEEGFGMIRFSSVPEVVADKLLSGSCDNLHEVTKGYLAKLETESLDYRIKDLSIQETSIEDENNWLRALRDCPRELVNLINSRACRGAIMFNDTLTMDQCIRLVQELSVTAYPFQCAHGRPSVVPLISLQDRRESGGSGLATQQPSSKAINWGALL